VIRTAVLTPKETGTLFDSQKYLERIGYRGSLEPTLATLCGLHRAHQQQLHYDNGYVQTTNFMEFDLDGLFETIVIQGRGGICTDLNFLFHRLLGELGFATKLLGAGILLPGGHWGSDVEHAVMSVRVDGADWLADVGHGGISILDPLPFDGEVHEQSGTRFRLSQEGEYWVLRYQNKQKPWRIAYRLTPEGRPHSAWNYLSELNTIHKDVMVRRRRCVTGNGQVMLTASLMVTIEDGDERSRFFRDDAQLQEIVSRYWA
jgi:amide synthase